MNTNKIKRSITAIVNAYKNKIATYNEGIFTKQPPIGGWSYSEVYSHIFDSSLLSLLALENCITGKGELKPTAFAVKMILFFGSLPPAQKYKVPPKLMERVKKLDKTTALAFISQFERELDKISLSINNANENSKTKHPRLGYLNAKQWLRFTEIHLKHHLKQLNRIEKSFLRSI